MDPVHQNKTLQQKMIDLEAAMKKARPKPPNSALQLFSQSLNRTQNIRSNNTEIYQQYIEDFVKTKWQQLPRKEQFFFEKSAQEDMERYLNEIKLYEPLHAKYNQVLQRSHQEQRPQIQQQQQQQQHQPQQQRHQVVQPPIPFQQPNMHQPEILQAHRWPQQQHPLQQHHQHTYHRDPIVDQYYHENKMQHRHLHAIHHHREHQPMQYPPSQYTRHLHTSFSPVQSPPPHLKTTTLQGHASHPHHPLGYSTMPTNANVGSHSSAAPIDIVCGGTCGSFLPIDQRIVCHCRTCARLPETYRSMSCTQFEVHSGAAAANNWQSSIRVRTPSDPSGQNLSLGQWIDMNRAPDSGVIRPRPVYVMDDDDVPHMKGKKTTTTANGMMAGKRRGRDTSNVVYEELFSGRVENSNLPKTKRQKQYNDAGDDDYKAEEEEEEEEEEREEEEEEEEERDYRSNVSSWRGKKSTTRKDRQKTTAPTTQNQKNRSSKLPTPWRDGNNGNFTPINVRWSGEHCSICDTDVDYDNDQLIMCDICGITVHQSCYGIPESAGIEDAWLCRACEHKESEGNGNAAPQCCLCPIVGGALKPSSIAGVWCHATCLQWIPEVTVEDAELMEPVVGIRSIHKERWELLCSLCKQRMGAKIQCESCCVAYHPLCARIAGYKMEIVDVRGKDDVALYSYCSKHCTPQPKLSGIRKVDDDEEYGDLPILSSTLSLWNGQPFPAAKALPIPQHHKYGCARSIPLLGSGCIRKAHGTGIGVTTESAFWIPGSIISTDQAVDDDASNTIEEKAADHKDVEIHPSLNVDSAENGNDGNATKDDDAKNRRRVEGFIQKQDMPAEQERIEEKESREKKKEGKQEKGGSDGDIPIICPAGKRQESSVQGQRPTPKISKLNLLHDQSSTATTTVANLNKKHHYQNTTAIDIIYTPTELIGMWCRIWWPEDGKWYIGNIKEYSSLQNQHCIVYETSNESEWVDIFNELKHKRAQLLSKSDDQSTWPKVLPTPVIDENKHSDCASDKNEKGKERVKERDDDNDGGNNPHIDTNKDSPKIPDCIDVVCNGIRGVLSFKKMSVTFEKGGQVVSPSEFERLCGRAATKKWKCSLRIDHGDGELGPTVEDWLASFETGSSKTMKQPPMPLRKSKRNKVMSPHGVSRRSLRRFGRTHKETCACIVCVQARRSQLEQTALYYDGKEERRKKSMHAFSKSRKRHALDESDVDDDEHDANDIHPKVGIRSGKQAFVQAFAQISTVGARPHQLHEIPLSRCWSPIEWAGYRLYQRKLQLQQEEENNDDDENARNNDENNDENDSSDQGATIKNNNNNNKNNIKNHTAALRNILHSSTTSSVYSSLSSLLVGGTTTILDNNASTHISLGFGAAGSGRALTLKEKLSICNATEHERLAFGKSGIHGWGLFAKVPMKQDTMVVEFRGELVRKSIADQRETGYIAEGSDCYMFNLDDEVVLDATRSGTIARFTNHSCLPSVYTKILSLDGELRLAFFARSDIQPGQELTYNYRFEPEEGEERIVCTCGAPNCFGYL